MLKSEPRTKCKRCEWIEPHADGGHFCLKNGDFVDNCRQYKRFRFCDGIAFLKMIALQICHLFK